MRRWPPTAIGAAGLAVCLGVAVGPVAATPLEKALDYLSARQDSSSGAVGPEPGRAADTSWTAIAVAARGEAPSAWARGGPALSSAVGGLAADAPGDILRLALAGAAAGSVDEVLAARVAGRQSADGSFAGAGVTTAWGVLALRAVGRPPRDAAVAAAVRALVAWQLPDGGWASAVGAQASDAVATSTAIQALRAARMPVGDPVLVGARARLLALRDPTGGFSRSAIPTAWAVTAIRALGEDPGRIPWARGGSPLAVLDRLQDADGGVRPTRAARPSVFATAMSALAWSGAVLPVNPGRRATPDRSPRVVRRTPASGDVVRGTFSVRYVDETGGSGIDPARTTISVNGIDITRRARVTAFTLQVRPSALPMGSLQVALTVRDRAGHATTTRWGVTGTG